MKLESFCTAKEVIDKMKREWEIILANHNKGLTSKICKNLTQLNSKKPK